MLLSSREGIFFSNIIQECYFIFLISLQKTCCGYSLEAPNVFFEKYEKHLSGYYYSDFMLQKGFCDLEPQVVKFCSNFDLSLHC